MTETFATQAARAQRRALVETLQQFPSMTLAALVDELERGPHAKALRTVTVAELRDVPRKRKRRRKPAKKQPRPPVMFRADKHTRDMLLREFQREPERWFRSGEFVQAFGIPRWIAQALLKKLVDVGRIERVGKTSTTRYRLLTEESSSLPPGRAKVGTGG